MNTDVVNAALQTGKGISDFGMMAITAGFFLVLSALLMVVCFRWFMKVINDVMTSHKDMLEDLNKQMVENNHVMKRIAEGLCRKRNCASRQYQMYSSTSL